MNSSSNIRHAHTHTSTYDCRKNDNEYSRIRKMDQYEANHWHDTQSNIKNQLQPKRKNISHILWRNARKKVESSISAYKLWWKSEEKKLQSQYDYVSEWVWFWSCVFVSVCIAYDFIFVVAFWMYYSRYSFRFCHCKIRSHSHIIELKQFTKFYFAMEPVAIEAAHPT